MAIQHRRGNFPRFDPHSLLPGEWAVVLDGDTSASDGRAVYICFAAGTVKRMATFEDMAAQIANANDQLIAQLIEEVSEGADAAAGRANAAAQVCEDNADTWAAAEAVRVSSETARAAAESARASAETSRSSAETARAAAEALRSSAEAARESAESSRASAESARASAETARASGYVQLVDGATAATTAANTAAASANTAASAATAAQVANDAAQTANNAAQTANDSAQAANDSAQEANDSAQAANDSAQDDNDLAQAANNAACADIVAREYISEPQIEDVAANAGPTGNQSLNLTGLSSVWAKIRAAFAAATHTHAASDVTGQLAVANGGTGLASAAAVRSRFGGIPLTTSSTAAATAAKTTGALDGFELFAGARVCVLSTYGSTAEAALTLNVASTGAKAVWAGGAATSASNPATWSAGAICEFIYDGTQWHYLGNNIEAAVRLSDSAVDASVEAAYLASSS